MRTDRSDIAEDCQEITVTRVRKWYTYMSMATTGRKFFISEEGWLGLAPSNSAPGDRIVLLEGGKTPFILRPTHVEGQFKILGDAYVHGIMDGEAWGDGTDLVDVILV